MSEHFCDACQKNKKTEAFNISLTASCNICKQCFNKLKLDMFEKYKKMDTSKMNDDELFMYDAVKDLLYENIEC